ncbi:hypothetical protein PspLS_01001 [Pyricularia sp. CBS 133598]|nr:hypothetical protein PspLS_01001 [Pyricularia sp. CBS 133598]
MSIFAPRSSVYEPSYSGLFRLIDDFNNYAVEANNNNNSSDAATTPKRGRSGLISDMMSWTPKFDLQETPNTYILHGEFPGMDKKDINIEFTDDQTVTIRGRSERSHTHEEPADEDDGDAVVVPSTGEKKSDKEVADKKSDEGKDNKQVEKSNASQHKVKYWVSERSFGEFSRSFNFPARIDAGGVVAKLDNGVLNIVVPKMTKPQGRKISIEIGDSAEPPHLSDFKRLADRTADAPVPIPAQIPSSGVATPAQPRFADSSIYPYLETNVQDLSMQFSQEPIPADRSELSVSLYGSSTPFRHWEVLRRYVSDIIYATPGHGQAVTYNTSVELVEKVGDEWRVVLRKPDGQGGDRWWDERFDAVVVANGHYNVPYVPEIEGLEEMQRAMPGSVLHSKYFRGRDQFKDKRVVVVGASVSAADIAFDIVKVAKSPVHAVVLGHTANPYFGDEAFRHPKVQMQPSIARVEVPPGGQGATVYFVDGTSASGVDYLMFGTGYSWTLPFLPQVQPRKNRVPGLYHHVVWQQDPTLLFVGAVGAGLTFKIFEWQAVLAARILAGRTSRPLPSLVEMQKWEADRIAETGDGPKFTVIHPHFDEYFEALRELAGDGEPGLGRKLPKFDPKWLDAFMDGHELRKGMWKRINDEARDESRPIPRL